MQYIEPRVHRGVNWNVLNDPYTQTIWMQNTKQFWLDRDIPVTDDLPTWETLPEGIRKTYTYALGGLTLLDTRQGGDGMPLLQLHETDDQRRAVLSFMGTMEHIHAKSYSTIFQTLLSREEEDNLFFWVEHNKHLQYKAERIMKYYDKLWNKEATLYEKYMAKAASVNLESHLFFSGFFMPLYLAGNGEMTNSGEIIDLIIRDESIHGLYIGVLAQEDLAKMDEETREEAILEVNSLVFDLYENEEHYTKEIYAYAEKDIPGITEQVLTFIRYNANKAMMNLGLETLFAEEEINPIIANGIASITKIHDFFSKKGNGYFRATNVQPVTDATFDFSRDDL